MIEYTISRFLILDICVKKDCRDIGVGSKLLEKVECFAREHKTLGIGEEEIKELMIKEVGNKVWNNGYLDMLGYMY